MVDDVSEHYLKTFDRVRKPWKHQEDILAIAASKQNFALFAEPGCGKSLAAIILARYKMHVAGRAMKVLVLTPPIVVKNWKDEWLAASKFTPDKVVCVTGTGKKRAETFKTTKALVTITNYETLLMADAFAAIRAWAPEIIIYDESHKLKNYASKRSKLAYELARQVSVRHRYILTGSPILNSLLDLFQQFLIMDMGDKFGHNFFSFRGKYFTDKNAGMPSQKYFPNWQVRAGAAEHVQKLIADTSIFVEKAKCLDLPDHIKIVIKTELSPGQAKAYKDLAKDFITYVGSRACVARMALTKALRLMQVASGFVALEGDDDNEASVSAFCDNPKDTALRDLLEDLAPTGKIIVWASFKHNYKSIRAVCEKLELPHVEVTGDISTKGKDEAVTKFRDDPKIKVLIGNPSAGGIGVNLIAAKYCIYYSRTFSLEHDLQSEARNYRGGSEIHDKVTRYDLVAENTIDETIAAKLASKQAISDSVIMGLALEMGK